MEKVFEVLKILRDSGINAQLSYMYHEGTKTPVIVLVGLDLKIGDCMQKENTVQ